MCSARPIKAAAPATPPPPAPILEQAAPASAIGSDSDQVKKKASGTKQYRNPLSISSGNTQTSSGLSISK